MGMSTRARRDKMWSRRTYSELFIIGLFLATLGVIIGMALSIYYSVAPIVVWGVTWSFLTAVVLWRVKTTVSDGEMRVSRKIVQDSLNELEANRRAVRKGLLENELRALRRGEKTPVLDIWRLNPDLARRHPFFLTTTSLSIDPKLRELQLRIQFSAIPEGLHKDATLNRLWNALASYLLIISQDAYLFAERSFFDKVVLMVDGWREDERHVDVSYPILGMSIDAAEFWLISKIPDYGNHQVKSTSGLQFDEGREIEPYRAVEGSQPHGSQ